MRRGGPKPLSSHLVTDDKSNNCQNGSHRHRNDGMITTGPLGIVRPWGDRCNQLAAWGGVFLERGDLKDKHELSSLTGELVIIFN